MEDVTARLRAIADELERAAPQEESTFKETFQLFELPEIVSSVVDFLQPALMPYESAIYWYMFRHSIVASGDVFVRVSTRGLQQGVVTSMRSGRDTSMLSYGAVKDALDALCEKGAISVAGDTTREGTPYRVYLPEEIALCREAMSVAQQEEVPRIDPKKELDYYNVKDNRLKVFERDMFRCHHCGKQLTRFSATLDHLQPVSEGGDNSYDNLITACLQCNSQRGARTLMDYLTRTKDARNL